MAATTPTHQPNFFRRVARFMSETMEELRKASWPGWIELRDSTLLVIISVLILGLFISMSDFSLSQLITFLTRQAAPGA